VLTAFVLFNTALPMDSQPTVSSIAARLRFKHLRLLIALDDLGSLHRAAESLSMTQPGATKALREIELIFGSTLFSRSSHGMRANELGLCAIRYARLIGSDLEHMREAIVGASQGSGGHLSVGAIAGALPSLLIRAVAKVRETQPNLSISIYEDTSANLLNAVSEGRIELAICRTTVASQPDLFHFDFLSDESVAVAAAPGHPLHEKNEVSLAELSQQRWVVYPSQMPLRTLLEREFSIAALPMPSGLIETSSTFITTLMLQEDPALVALLSSETLDFYAGHGVLKRLPIALQTRAEPYGIVSRRGATFSPLAMLLVTILHRMAPRPASTP
jgi:DNA-binding transcriptional LysR family regulator